MMTNSSLFSKKIRQLSQALLISGMLNIVILSFWLYWMLREYPPTPYCVQKPASKEQRQIPLADLRESPEVLAVLSQSSFVELVDSLSHTQIIENGYAERDLALSCLITFHHFDLLRALGQEIQSSQTRLLMWRKVSESPLIPLLLYPGLAQSQFDQIIQFAKSEKWPLTAEGLFLALQKQKMHALDVSLMEAFMLTPEFWAVEWLFNRSEKKVDKTELLMTLLEGNWTLLKQFSDQQKIAQDSSEARRQKFLLDYMNLHSPVAAALLLKVEWNFCTKKLEDGQVIHLLQLIPQTLSEGERFAKEMLGSPRSTNVWKQAARWLYMHAHEPIPQEWNYSFILARFLPEKLKGMEKEKMARLSPAIPLPSKSNPREKVKTETKKNAVSRSSLNFSSAIASQQLLNGKKKKGQSHFENYTVQEGDNLWKISRRFKMSVEALKTANGLSSDVLQPGTVLKISKDS